MKQDGLAINGAILKWARETSGLSLENAAIRAKISAPRKLKGQEPRTAGDRLRAWEDGQEKPTLAQLKLMAKAYRRPLVTFFLPAPPKQVDVLADFRTVTNRPQESPEFAALKRRIIALHRELVTIAKEENAVALSFVGSANMKEGVANLTRAICNGLGLGQGWQTRQPSIFRFLRDKIQESGIFVVLMGDLGSHHSRVAVEEFRGVAIADPLAPLIVINSNDSESARLFTLIHELVHIWLGNSGVSNEDSFAPARPDSPVEKLCNAVAAELLVPQDMLTKEWEQCRLDGMERINEIAKAFSVSGQVVARRLWDMSLIPRDEYNEIMRISIARGKRQQNQTRSGPSADVLFQYRMGTKMLATFSRAVNDGMMSILDAARTLEISAGRFMKVAG